MSTTHTRPHREAADTIRIAAQVETPRPTITLVPGMWFILHGKPYYVDRLSRWTDAKGNFLVRVNRGRTLDPSNGPATLGSGYIAKETGCNVIRGSK